MERSIRIGKDFNVRWSINKVVDGERQPYELAGKELVLQYRTPYGLKEASEWKAEGNTIVWTFRGKEQKALGSYELILTENGGKDGMVTVDTCRAFKLVAHSCEETEGSGSDIVIEDVVLESEVTFAALRGPQGEQGPAGPSYDDTEIKGKLAELSAEVSEIEGEVMGVIGRETLTSNKKRIGLWVDNTPNIGSYKFRITSDNPPVDKFKIYKATEAHGGLEVIAQDAAFGTWVEIERDAANPVLYIYSTEATDETIDVVTYNVDFGGATLREDIDNLSNQFNAIIDGSLGEETKTSTRNRIAVWIDDAPLGCSYKIRITCPNPSVEKFNISKATKEHGGLERIVYAAQFNQWYDIEADANKPVLYICETGVEDTIIPEREYLIEYHTKGDSLKERVEQLENPRDLYAYYKNAPKLYNKPLVCLVFDVPIYYISNALIQEFMDYCDKLNLKVSIATSTNATFASTLENNGWFERMQNGHDIVNYPLDDEVKDNVGSAGFGSCDESSVMARYAKNKAAFDALGIKMDVGIWHNSSVRVPSAVSQVRELYKTIIGGLGKQYIQEMCEDLSCWNRYKIEGRTFDTLKTFFDAVLGQQKVVVFGTHLVSSNGVMLQYDNYINEIKPFLRYLSDLVNAGLIASVSITHALESVQNERAIRNYIPYKRYEFTAPISEIYRTQTAVNRVTNGGKPYVFKLDIVGTASGGAIGISIDGDSGSESKSISVPSGASAEAVAALFYTHAFFSNYRTKVVGSSVYFHRCRTDNVDVAFEITSNTSGVTITKTDIVNAVAHTVTNL